MHHYEYGFLVVVYSSLVNVGLVVLVINLVTSRRRRTIARSRRLPGGNPPSTTFLATMARFGSRESLDDSVAGEHATIDGEVAANHESPHSGILLRQLIRSVRLISLIFPAIDQD